MAHSTPAQSSEDLSDLASCSTHPFDDVSLLICHELRTPLASLQGALKLLGYEQSGSLSDDGQRLLAIAINNAERLTRLADALESQPAPLLTLLSTDEMELLQLQTTCTRRWNDSTSIWPTSPSSRLMQTIVWVKLLALRRWPGGSTAAEAPSLPMCLFPWPKRRAD
jgi:hypothetical protein